MAMILVVEDDVFHRDLLARFVQYLGHEATLASNGMEAVTIAQRDTPHLILMDMGLPVLDGWQATQQLRVMFSREALPIIALTAYAQVEEQDRCLAAGCNDYATKPIDFTRLDSLIQHWLAQR